MRTSSIVISALLGAGAIAHPTLRGLHVHHKRGPAELVNSWDEGNTHYEEFESTTTVVLPAGEQAPSTTTSEQQPAIEDKHVTPNTNNNNNNNQQQAAYSPQEHHDAVPATTTTPVPSVTPSVTPVSSPATSSGGDSGNAMLDSFNKMRAQWNPALKPYTWDATLAANAAKTVKDDGGSVMTHELNPGSNAQCIAEGSDGNGADGRTGFEQAAAMWMCEKPAGSLDCGSAKNSNGDTGHADIISSGSYSTVGCAYQASTTGGTATGDGQKGLWACDYH
ncbi:MAG: hypothetical protein OHK93_000382 [Ramalina farinacea]|uniref:SCP domain-containing protein n=1 Tax=Ramalina farinacea TaxID=258253 RepID=A0AA43QER6_9LECA|nr:hypothetical protein [Ramalina farinacea]